MIYQKFASSDIVAGRTQTVSSGFFNDGNYKVSQYALTNDSTQIQAFGSTTYDVQNGLYYWDVYYNNQVHFSIAYGDLNNSASCLNDFTTTKIFPFSSNYQSYVNLLLTPSETEFSFLTGSYDITSKTLTTSTVQSPTIFAINFNANLYKNQIDPGMLEFSLKGDDNTVYTFIDDSSIVNKKSEVYNIIEGYINDQGVPVPVSSSGIVAYKSIGLFYPKNGVVILNASAIDNLYGLPIGNDSDNNDLSFAPSEQNMLTSSYATYQSCLYESIIGANTKYIKVRKSELIPTTQYYVRVQNGSFNYTNNPTFVSDGTDGLTKGTIKIPELRTNPTTYFTTVGLYDESNELVAVAKLSQPLQKSFDNEQLLKVNLAY